MRMPAMSSKCCRGGRRGTSGAGTRRTTAAVRRSPAPARADSRRRPSVALGAEGEELAPARHDLGGAGSTTWPGAGGAAGAGACAASWAEAGSASIATTSAARADMRGAIGILRSRRGSRRAGRRPASAGELAHFGGVLKLHSRASKPATRKGKSAPLGEPQAPPGSAGRAARRSARPSPRRTSRSARRPAPAGGGARSRRAGPAGSA